MSKKTSFISYANKSDIDTQSLYLDDKAAFSAVPELLKIGAKRVLVITDSVIRKHGAFERIISFLEENNLRVFIYCREDKMLTERDISAALKMFQEFNCNCLIPIGGTPDIDCGKIVGAMARNPSQSAVDLCDIKKFKIDIPILFCIVIDNSSSSATASAEFLGNDGQWHTMMSNFLVPHIVAIESELSERVPIAVTIRSAFNALCMATEAYISPSAPQNPDYRANAVIACLNIFDTLEKVVENPSDTYLRRKLAVGGFYAGLASRKTGIGYAHIIMHAIISKKQILHGQGIGIILPSVLSESLETDSAALAELAREIPCCTRALDTMSAAQSYIEHINRLHKKLLSNETIPPISHQEIDEMVSEIMRKSEVYELKRKLDSRKLYRILNIFTM